MSDLNAILDALPGFPQLRGARVRLRAPRAQDALRVFALFSDPAVMRHWSSSPMTDPAQASVKLEEMHDALRQREIHWIVADAQDNAIGTCSLFHCDAKYHSGEIGYALRSDLWSRGLASEAVEAALNWGFAALALRSVGADTHLDNAPSQRLLRRLGFRPLSRPRELATTDDAGTRASFVLSAEQWRQRGASKPDLKQHRPRTRKIGGD
ncbi:MAG: GNAT family N-acetyltransferase [Luteimonas sp.]